MAARLSRKPNKMTTQITETTQPKTATCLTRGASPTNACGLSKGGGPRIECSPCRSRARRDSTSCSERCHANRSAPRTDEETCDVSGKSSKITHWANSRRALCTTQDAFWPLPSHGPSPLSRHEATPRTQHIRQPMRVACDAACGHGPSEA